MTGWETALYSVCINTHTHTHTQIDTQMYAHMLTSWMLGAYAHAADTNTYFSACYLRIPVIVHMQRRLSKHGEQKNKLEVGVDGGGVLLNKH